MHPERVMSERSGPYGDSLELTERDHPGYDAAYGRIVGNTRLCRHRDSCRRINGSG